MAHTAPELQDRIRLLEENVKRLTETVQVLARLPDDDHALEETRLDDGSPASRNEARFATLGRLAVGMAHDVNNLLSALLANSGILSAKLGKESPLLRHTADIGVLAHQAADLMHYLADRTEARTDATYERVELTELFAKLKRLLPKYAGPDLTVDMTPPAAPMTWPMETMQAVRLLLNLVGNARAATPRGGRILIEARHEDHDLRRPGLPDALPPGRYGVLAVSDTGAGMSEGEIRRAFRSGHAGRGLSIVARIVREANGFVQVESEPGRGTRLSVYIPD